MALTNRANAWLATLPREPALDTARVEQLIVDAGWIAHPVWLDFHDRYAGYIEEVGPDDFAIWGLARAADADPPSRWRDADAVTIFEGHDGYPESISCADAHPVHEYELRADGRFPGIGGPVPTFDMKIERHGVMHEYLSRGPSRRTLITKIDRPEHQRLLQEMAPFLVPEASSPASQLFLAPARLLRFNAPVKQMVLWELESAVAGAS